MSAIAARAGRGLLAVLAVAALVATVGLLDARTMPGWMLPAAAATAAVSGMWWWLARQLHRAPALDRHTEPVPGGAIGWTTIPGSCDYGDVAVYPADPHGPVDLGTVSPMMLGQLRAAPDALHLRVRASLLGGVR